jgi:uncharacterized protein involved in exopolysaccharide biosynthesis
MDKLQELKAAAYDLLANIEWLQAKLRETNQQIAEEAKKQQDNGQSGNSDRGN